MLHDNTIKKEELKARALALKVLGKIFQVEYSFLFLLIVRGQATFFFIIEVFLVLLKFR